MCTLCCMGHKELSSGHSCPNRCQYFHGAARLYNPKIEVPVNHHQHYKRGPKNLGLDYTAATYYRASKWYV